MTVTAEPAVARAQVGDIRTPIANPSGPTLLFSLRLLPRLAAQMGAWLAWIWGKPFRFGKLVIAARHVDVSEAFNRDLDFLIHPIYAARFDDIDFHFILGMDRSAELARERHALYAALSQVDTAGMQAVTKAAIAQRLAASPKTIDVVEDYARPVAAATASALFGIAPADPALFMDVSRAIFSHCFLNLAGDKVVEARAKAAAVLLADWLRAEIARRRKSGALGDELMGRLLQAGVADDLTRRTLGGMLVGSIDTTATVIAKVITVMMEDRRLLASARRHREDLPHLYGLCQEALRRWTQTPILGRAAAHDTMLGGVAIPAGVKVVLWTQAAMFDASAFPDPRVMRADRDPRSYLHLGAGLHPCAGRGVNAWQIPMLVAGLLEEQPTGLGPMTWAGALPAHLPLHRRSAR